ncbi:adenylyl-sulfate kinase [Pseudomonadota bacterium]
MAVKSQNITKVEHRIDRDERWSRNNHKGAVVWFTGLSASGKSTLATMLEQRLFETGRQVYVLDGDNVRHGLCSDLGFSADDREENIRRIGELAALFMESGLIAISAFISPYRRDRRLARKAAGGNFHEIYLQADLEVCEKRDPKGLYAKAREGVIKDFTGISAPYEAPEAPELVVDTGTLTLEESVDMIVDYVERHVAL